MSYIDQDYYENTYMGLDPSNPNINTYIKRACDIVDMITAQQIVHIGFDNLIPLQQELVQKATAAQTEFFIENSETYTQQPGDSGVNDVKIGNFSYKNSTGKATESLRASISVFAKAFLEQAGLTNRGVAVKDSYCYEDQKFATDCDCDY